MFNVRMYSIHSHAHLFSICFFLIFPLVVLLKEGWLACIVVIYSKRYCKATSGDVGCGVSTWSGGREGGGCRCGSGWGRRGRVDGVVKDERHMGNLQKKGEM